MKKLLLFSVLLLSFGAPLHLPTSHAEEEIGAESEFDEEFGEDTDFSEDSFSDSDFSDFGSDDEVLLDEETAEPTQTADSTPVEEPPPAQEPAPEAIPAESDVAETPEEPQLEELTEPAAPSTPIVEEPTFEEPTPEPPPVFVETPTADDSPDLEYEARLHDIYINFLSKKTPDAEWNNLVGIRNAERYQIQGGDNLWNISRTLFGDGNYWPKIWSLNGGSITNPHLISPQNTIRFILGDESGPPAFTVTENSTTEVEESGEVEFESESSGYSQEPEIPPPLIRSRPVAKRLPPSLPEWQDASTQGNYDELGIDYGRRKILDVVDQIPLNGYVSETPPPSVGRVSEIEAGSALASALQYVYITMEPGVGDIGDSFLVVRNVGEVKSSHATITGFLGYSIEVQGEVQLVERVPGRNEADGRELYRAIVTKVVNPVSVNSVLITGKIENIRLAEEGPRSQVVAQIVGGLFFNKRQVYGPESIAFLNRGANDGLEPGQLLSVRENRLIRNNDTLVGGNVRPIGWMKIVRVTPRFSTAVIVRSWSDILTGDITGAGEFQVMQPRNGPADSTASSRSLLDELDSGGPAPAPSGDDFSEGDFSGDDFSEGDFSDEGASDEGFSEDDFSDGGF